MHQERGVGSGTAWFGAVPVTFAEARREASRACDQRSENRSSDLIVPAENRL